MATLLNTIKERREETSKAAQRQWAAPTVRITDQGEGPFYRMRGALQPRVEKAEEEVWVQKQSDPMLPRGTGEESCH